jgi:preprotein translocase subunit SecB
MIEKFKILAKYIKDMSSETADIETFLFVKENISKYQLNIDITSKALKNKFIEVNTTLKFEDKEPSEKKSHYEIVYATIIQVEDDVKEKK